MAWSKPVNSDTSCSMTPTKSLATCNANQTGVSIYNAPTQHSSSLPLVWTISSLLAIPKQSLTLQHPNFANASQSQMAVTLSGCSAAAFITGEIDLSLPSTKNNISLVSYPTSIWSTATWLKHHAPLFISHLLCALPTTVNDVMLPLFLTAHLLENVCICKIVPDLTSPLPFANLHISCPTMELNITRPENTS